MTGRRSRTPAAPVSYSLSIPLGWIRVPGRLDRDSTLAAVQGQVDDVEGSDPGWRDEVGPVLDEAFRADTGRRVLDAYLALWLTKRARPGEVAGDAEALLDAVSRARIFAGTSTAWDALIDGAGRFSWSAWIEERTTRRIPPGTRW